MVGYKVSVAVKHPFSPAAAAVAAVWSSSSSIKEQQQQHYEAAAAAAALGHKHGIKQLHTGRLCFLRSLNTLGTTTSSATNYR